MNYITNEEEIGMEEVDPEENEPEHVDETTNLGNEVLNLTKNEIVI